MATVRAQIVLSEDLDREIDRAVKETGNNRSELMRKALTLYLAAVEKKRQGLRLGFARPDQTLETEVIGLYSSGSHDFPESHSACKYRVTPD